MLTHGPPEPSSHQSSGALHWANAVDRLRNDR